MPHSNASRSGSMPAPWPAEISARPSSTRAQCRAIRIERPLLQGSRQEPSRPVISSTGHRVPRALKEEIDRPALIDRLAGQQQDGGRFRIGAVFDEHAGRPAMQLVRPCRRDLCGDHRPHQGMREVERDRVHEDASLDQSVRDARRRLAGQAGEGSGATNGV